MISPLEKSQGISINFKRIFQDPHKAIAEYIFRNVCCPSQGQHVREEQIFIKLENNSVNEFQWQGIMVRLVIPRTDAFVS